ncbi:unnamed protein product [Effrenium voratum]|nr:unnamed protein product [Effrenium voratum]
METPEKLHRYLSKCAADEGLAVGEVLNSPLTSPREQAESSSGGTSSVTFDQLVADAQSRIGVWLSAADTERELPAPRPSPEAVDSRNSCPLQTTCAVRRFHEQKLVRKDQLSAAYELPVEGSFEHPSSLNGELQDLAAKEAIDLAKPAEVAAARSAQPQVMTSEEFARSVAEVVQMFESGGKPLVKKADKAEGAIARQAACEQAAELQAEEQIQAAEKAADETPRNASLVKEQDHEQDHEAEGERGAEKHEAEPTPAKAQQAEEPKAEEKAEELKAEASEPMAGKEKAEPQAAQAEAEPKTAEEPKAETQRLAVSGSLLS